MKKIIASIINFFWPFLEGAPITYKNFIDKNDIPIETKKKDVDYAYKMYLNQKDRIKTIESKSIVFIGIFGSSIALLAFVIKDLLMIENQNIWAYIGIIITSILVIYSSQVMRYSIKALERKEYNEFSYDDFLNKTKKETFFNIIYKIQKNYDAINNKVDNMTLAQDFMKRVLYVIICCAVAFFFYGGWMIATKFIDFDQIFLFLKTFDFLIFFIVFMITIIIIFFSIFRLKIRINKLEKAIQKENDENVTVPNSR